MPPVAGIIDQEHCCNRHSAEDVHGEEPCFLILHSAIVQQACKNATDSGDLYGREKLISDIALYNDRASLVRFTK